jgi:hypothetical protein
MVRLRVLFFLALIFSSHRVLQTAFALQQQLQGCACAPEQNGAPKVGNPQPTKGWADLTPQAHPT